LLSVILLIINFKKTKLFYKQFGRDQQLIIDQIINKRYDNINIPKGYKKDYDKTNKYVEIRENISISIIFIQLMFLFYYIFL